ncbi:MAG: glutaredoxin 3 [Alphaproteobacteria bacterium RIFCSPLOWO2_01_FULL_40_26]|nr:MAG: glutaredoxin 3 [Alphaproteobacteria bacterium RIFCSPHIGHO2_02_FULL_40_34]OFW94123.1 MAG: glutaredoxin 3 [Alphaproteobacteria bacterium RIFCSPLOWO2_01_FULL_40_26]OFX09708.1 MAG: glutaredoxin 3 [Alphaproteobacteria bacterium RIFCSPLOWO2_02_FULL_40_19]OFX11388.1 MAG: glutaredoxin 3 [Alphaproteobacteria bacterium RIFCSPLOWO2_12_FULL_40_11]
MTKIIIYTTQLCPYCVRAKMLLQKKGLVFEEIKVADDKIREEMVKKSNGRMSVPQIFIGEKHIGGCDDLYALEAAGKLDELLDTVS